MTENLSEIAANFEHSLSSFKSWMQVQRIGCSFEDRPIYGFRWGSGAKKILICATINGTDIKSLAGVLSTMRLLEGNETDVVSYGTLIKWKANYTLYFIPVLNPDGLSNAYSENAMGINIYNDARSQITPESQILEATLKSYKPDFIIGLKSVSNTQIIDISTHHKKLLFLDIPTAQNCELKLSEEKTVPNKKVLSTISSQVTEKLTSCVGILNSRYSTHEFGSYFQKNGIPTLIISPLDEQQDVEEYKVVNLVEKSLIYMLNNLSDVDQEVEKKSIQVAELHLQKPAEFDMLFKKASITASNGKRFIADVGYEKNATGFKLKQIGDLEGTTAKEIVINQRLKLGELHKIRLTN